MKYELFALSERLLSGALTGLYQGLALALLVGLTLRLLRHLEPLLCRQEPIPRRQPPESWHQPRRSEPEDSGARRAWYPRPTNR